MPASRGWVATEPKACWTPTSPGLITTAGAPRMTITPTAARPRDAPLRPQVEQPRDGAEALETGVGALIARDLQRAALVEPVHDVVHVRAAHPRGERRARRAPDQVLGDHLGALQLALVLELELAGDRGQGGIHVRHARYDVLLLGGHRAPLGVRDHVLEQADGQALRHPGAPVHALVLARLERHALHHFRHEVGHAHRARGTALEPRFLALDHRSHLDGVRVGRHDLQPDALFHHRPALPTAAIVLAVP